MDPLTEEVSRKFFKDLMVGVEYMHTNKLIHRDIKPENLLLAANGQLKLADFGTSQVRGRVLWCVAVCCSVLQWTIETCRLWHLAGVWQWVAVHCSVLQSVAECCRVLQCDAVWCSVLQCVATDN